ncbi:PD-(D/E)XK nuclease family protein [Pseudoduganella sp.]|uniref:PD-(D/E)XK nuclease family protein n=1 Tax=Pseudoduganella sp. TaxID=1880898 RepID=UPI0035B33BF3
MKMHDLGLDNELEHLCASNEFKTLLDEWNRFSPFRVMRAERQEIRHTTTLAWLLDPRGSHQLGDVFLNSFLRRLPGFGQFSAENAQASCAHVSREVPLSTRQKADWPALEQEDDFGALQKKSGNRLDVLVEGRSANGRPWAVAIEAKIGSKQAPGQLQAYAAHLKRRFENADLLMLYLTINEDEPQGCDEWVNVLWGATVASALDATLQADIGTRVKEFLQDYQHLLRFAADDSGSELAQKISTFANSPSAAPVLRRLKWQSKALRDVRGWSASARDRTFWQHESLLRKCMAAVLDPSALLVWKTVSQHLAPRNDFSILTESSNNTLSVQFVPKAWENLAPLKHGGSWNLCYHAEFRNVQQDIELKLYLPPRKDNAPAKNLVEALQAKGRLRPDFEPQQAALANYLAPEGKSLKLHTMTIAWALADDGSVTIDEQALAGFCARFSAQCTVHTKALQAAFAS